MRTQAAALLFFALAFAGPAAAAPALVTIPVQLGGAAGPLSGRLLVFARKVEPGAKPDEAIDASAFSPTETAVAAREIGSTAAGTTVAVDGETGTFPAPFSTLPPGTYRFQAVLDRNHDYNYAGRGGGDLVSPVVETKLPGTVPALALARELPTLAPGEVPPWVSARTRAAMEAAKAALQPIDFTSPALTAFWGRATHVRGWVALPPGYDANANRTYPTVYVTGGFGSDLRSAFADAATHLAGMKAGTMPPMIYVVLDESSATGTHEFADSVNNGPWGQALTAELIPYLEGRYRMDARPSGRFLTGHSSGGWATLWLQVRYPKLFGGTWPTSPDPSDFHGFTNVDLYNDADFYAGADGTDHPLVRDKGQVIATLRQFGRLEAVLGEYGGQFASFEWVFSPRGADGHPMPLFDRTTGTIDKAVVAYWRDYYDIAHRIERDWATLKPDLDGKIHLTVGTADTFYLDDPAHRLQAVLDRLGARCSFRYLPGKTHGDLYARGDDPQALAKDIAWEMYAVARSGEKRPASAR